MKVDQYCKRIVVTISPGASLVDAARLMRDEHVGFLVVVDENGDTQRPVGVLTDRDIVVQVNAREVDPRSLTVADVMTREPIMAMERDDIGELLQRMRSAGVRRAPVVDVRGDIAGVIAIDDALDMVTGLLCDITGSMQNEQRIERRMRTA